MERHIQLQGRIIIALAVVVVLLGAFSFWQNQQISHLAREIGNHDYSYEISSLQSENESLKSRVSDLESQLLMDESDISSLESRVGYVESETNYNSLKSLYRSSSYDNSMPTNPYSW